MTVSSFAMGKAQGQGVLESLALCESLQQADELVLGLSGGMDSTALLVALCEVYPEKPKRALHVHHGLLEEADAWVDHCALEVERLNQQLPAKGQCQFEVARVHVELTGHGLEAAARSARYQVFAKAINTANRVLVLAHHSDDQLETLWLRLIRGTGIKGLQGMPSKRPFASGVLLRPWLTHQRSDILAYAQSRHLRWVEDPTNAEIEADRNWLRHKVLPEVKRRKPQVLNSVHGLIKHAQHAQSILDEVLAADWHQSVRQGDQSLDLNSLARLSDARQQQLLSRWLQAQLQSLGGEGARSNAGALAMQVESVWVEALQQQVIRSRADRQPCLRIKTLMVRRYQQRLYALPLILPSLPQAPSGLSKPAQAAPGLTLADGSLNLMDGSLNLMDCLRNKEAEVVQYPWIFGHLQICLHREQGLPLSAFSKEAAFIVRPAGALLRLPNKPKLASLKHWLQEQGIFPWLRTYLPCLVDNHQVVDVAGLLCHSYPQGSIESDASQSIVSQPIESRSIQPQSIKLQSGQSQQADQESWGLMWKWVLPKPFRLQDYECDKKRSNSMVEASRFIERIEDN